ncbi:MAG TPA: GTP cyclohydrolase I, partial [Candidatus Limnocylindrales bacterium]|nr:GTP cyclohydrolase I [Candidatus Limnocylindrales bacterium]
MDRNLPDRVQQLVDEIENEVGEDGFAISANLTAEISDALQNGSHDSGRDGQGSIEAAVREILTEIGEDPDRQGLERTPDRVRRMYHELTAGYHVDPERLVNSAIFDVDYSEMVVVKDISFYSLCE